MKCGKDGRRAGGRLLRALALLRCLKPRRLFVSRRFTVSPVAVRAQDGRVSPLPVDDRHGARQCPWWSLCAAQPQIRQPRLINRNGDGLAACSLMRGQRTRRRHSPGLIRARPSTRTYVLTQGRSGPAAAAPSNLRINPMPKRLRSETHLPPIADVRCSKSGPAGSEAGR